MEPAHPAVLIMDFPGLMTNVDPRDLPTGAAEEQTNLTCIVTGELRQRLGMREVTFEE